MRPYPSSFFILLSNIYCSPTPEEYYRDADQLLYLAKEQGRDRFVIGDPDEEVTALEP